MSATTEIPAISPATPLPPLAPVGTDESADDSGDRSFVLTWLLSLLFGFLGLDQQYVALPVLRSVGLADPARGSRRAENSSQARTNDRLPESSAASSMPTGASGGRGVAGEIAGISVVADIAVVSHPVLAGAGSDAVDAGGPTSSKVWLQLREPSGASAMGLSPFCGLGR